MYLYCMYIFFLAHCARKIKYFRRRRFFSSQFRIPLFDHILVHIRTCAHSFSFPRFFSGTTAVCLIAIFSTLRCIYGWKPVHKRMREEKGTSWEHKRDRQCGRVEQRKQRERESKKVKHLIIHDNIVSGMKIVASEYVQFSGTCERY